jgi:hypothetical protein
VPAASRQALTRPVAAAARHPLQMPNSCAGVPADLLHPSNTWKSQVRGPPWPACLGPPAFPPAFSRPPAADHPNPHPLFPAPQAEYDATLDKLGHLFEANFKTYLHDAEVHVGADMAQRILSGGPMLAGNGSS